MSNPSGWRQNRVMKERVTIWRQTETIATSGRPSVTWGIAATAVPCHLNSRPSQFQIQAIAEAGLLVEGDNIYTLDAIQFQTTTDVQGGDVLKFTTADPLIAGGFWKLRGDIQPRTWAAGKQVFIAARLERAPHGVS